MNGLLADLRVRGLIDACSDEEGFSARLDRGRTIVYCGFDPTAPSLHVGHLLGLVMLRRFQQAGHQPIALVGGFTGGIGDPSGRTQERQRLRAETLDANTRALKAQIARLLPAVDGFAEPWFVDNRDWLGPVDLLAFLQDIGTRVPISELLGKESVKGRLTHGGTVTEMLYPLLQAQDWRVLREREDCEVQLGGADQWGNITLGLEFLRRTQAGNGFGLTWPLLLNKQTGLKFGKSATGKNIWLDPAQTSPFAFFQFWRNADDEDAERLLLQFTLIPVEEIAVIMGRHHQDPGARHAQRTLAAAMTEWVHGPNALHQAIKTSEAVFAAGTGLSESDIDELETSGIPTVRIGAGDSCALDTIAAQGFGLTKSAARRLIEGKGLSLDGELVTLAGLHALQETFQRKPWGILRKGRQTVCLVRLCND